MTNIISMAQVSDLSLKAVTSDIVEVCITRLEQLERLAGVGRFTQTAFLLILSVAALYIVVTAIARKAIKDGCNRWKFGGGQINTAVEDAIKRECSYGLIHKAIQKEIIDSCRYGAIYDIAKFGKVPDRYVDEDEYDEGFAEIEDNFDDEPDSSASDADWPILDYEPVSLNDETYKTDPANELESR